MKMRYFIQDLLFSVVFRAFCFRPTLKLNSSSHKYQPVDRLVFFQKSEFIASTPENVKTKDTASVECICVEVHHAYW